MVVWLSSKDLNTEDYRTMTATWKTVRVFISSTFLDMQAERDHLVRFVFPKLRQELLPRRIHLVDVDLRWGVTSEQDALSVCREVITDCHPRFLCMLGGRYGTIPDDKELSITADEVHFGVLDKRRERIYAFFYFRHGAVTEKMNEENPGPIREQRHSERARKLARLKHEIRKSKHKRFLYRPQWNADERRLLDLKTFGDRVAQDILATIDDQFGHQLPQQTDDFTEESAAMEAFIEERVQRFVLGSRESVLNELFAHASSTGGNGYVCLTGTPGSGKSALLAHLSQLLTLNPKPSTLLISHFVGASPGSTDVRRTLRRLCHELMTGSGQTAEIPEDPEKLRVAFAEILQQAAAQKHVVILLDAINQLDSATQLADWSWLPDELPATARIILSTLSGPALDSLRQRRQPPRLVELQPLDAYDREAIIREFLHRYRKSMTADQRAALLAKADAGKPLYLLVALEELRTLGTHEEINDCIEQLPPDTRSLFTWILQRLEDDDGFRDASGRKIGQELVKRFVSSLGSSRHGLSQQELVELLSPGDPQGNVAALAQLLRPYLMQRGELLDFYHGQLREAVAALYMSTEACQLQAHVNLADYFECHSAGSRQISEFPWQLAAAKEWQRLYGWLADRESFLKAWEHDSFDVRNQWAQVEAVKDGSPLRMNTAYHTQIEHPESEPDKIYLGLLAILLTGAGYSKEALGVCQHLADHYRDTADVDKLPAALGSQADILRLLGDLDRAMELHKENERISRRSGNLRLLASSLLGQALIMRTRGDFDGAMTKLAEQERICRLSGNRSGLQSALSVQALIRRDRGDLDGAMARHKEAEQMARQSDDQDGLQVTLNNQAIILGERGDWDGALALHKKQGLICRQLGDNRGLAQSLTNEGSILYQSGDLDGAMALQKKAEEICRQINYLDCLQSVLGAQALILKARGNMDGAAALLEEAERLCRRLGNLDGLQATLSDQALILLERGEMNRAKKLFQEQERICRQMGHVKGLVWALTYQGGILCEQGQITEGLRITEEAYRLAKSRGHEPLANKIEGLLNAVRESVQRN
jgi:tetratricopeptide (TPR) repeat protein